MVAHDVELIRQEGAKIGLKLNATKCELILPDQSTNPYRSVISPTFTNFALVPLSQATLLGAPITDGLALSTSLSSAVTDLTKAIERLRHLDAHYALILLRACFSAPKLMFILRGSPCHQHPALDEFDTQLKLGISQITNTAISDLQMLQASLPVKDGGLGIRSVASLALPAYLASAASTCNLQDKILHRTNFLQTDLLTEEYRGRWQQATGCSCPFDPASYKQNTWDRPLINLDLATLINSQPDMHNKARMAAVSTLHSGDWLFALPITTCGLRLDNEAVCVAVGLRLGINLCEPHTCPCGAMVDARGSHGLSCKSNPGRMSRHHQLNDVIHRAFSRCCIPAVKEPSGLSRSDGKRPDGMTLIPWRVGECLFWDVTVVDTLANSYLPSTSVSAGSAAEQAAIRKESKYASLTASYEFIPLAFETLGPINGSAVSFLSTLGHRMSDTTSDCRETSFLFQRISIIIQRFNAVCFRNTLPSHFSGDDDS